MPFSLRLLVFSVILQTSVGLVEFLNSKLYDETDFASNVVYVPLFCAPGCRIYVSVPATSSEIAKKIMIVGFSHSDVSFYDISILSNGHQKGYVEIAAGNAQVNFVNNNPGLATAPIAVWIVRADADNYIDAIVYDAANLHTAPASIDVATVMSAEPFVLRTRTEGKMQMVSTLSGYDAVASGGADDCVNVVQQLDSDTYQDLQVLVQSPMITLFFDSAEYDNTKIMLIASVETVGTFDFSGVSFVASPGYICKGQKNYYSSLYNESNSLSYSQCGWLYDVDVSTLLNVDDQHHVTLMDFTNEMMYSWPGINPTTLSLHQTNNFEISWSMSPDQSFLIRLTPSNAQQLGPEVNCYFTTTVVPTSPVTTPTPAPKDPFRACPNGFELVRAGECRGLRVSEFATYADVALLNATALCSDVQAQPITIRDAEHQKYWSGRSSNPIPIGLVCDEPSRKWRWMDGTAVYYKPGKYSAELEQGCVPDGQILSWFLKVDGEWELRWTHNELKTDIYCESQVPPLPVPSADGCDSFPDDSADGVCYQIGTQALDWRDAQRLCRAVGGDLATIHNARENNFIRRLAVSNGAVAGLYLGALLSGKGDEFLWIDGSESNYNNFYPGFPKSELGNCLVMDTRSKYGQWANAACDSPLSVACMRQQNFTKPTCAVGPFRENELISSPGFPFDASTPCDFKLEVEPGKRVQLEVVFLEANSCCDELLLLEGSGKLITTLSGEINGQFYTSSSNQMRVVWAPMGGLNVRGMMIRYNGI